MASTRTVNLGRFLSSVKRHCASWVFDPPPARRFSDPGNRIRRFVPSRIEKERTTRAPEASGGSSNWRLPERWRGRIGSNRRIMSSPARHATLGRAGPACRPCYRQRHDSRQLYRVAFSSRRRFPGRDGDQPGANGAIWCGSVVPGESRAKPSGSHRWLALRSIGWELTYTWCSGTESTSAILRRRLHSSLGTSSFVISNRCC